MHLVFIIFLCLSIDKAYCTCLVATNSLQHIIGSCFTVSMLLYSAVLYISYRCISKYLNNVLKKIENKNYKESIVKFTVSCINSSLLLSAVAFCSSAFISKFTLENKDIILFKEYSILVYVCTLFIGVIKPAFIVETLDRENLFRIPHNAAKKIFRILSVTFLWSILALFVNSVISSAVGVNRTITTCICCMLTLLYALELYIGRESISMISQEKEYESAGIVYTVLKYMDKNWWKFNIVTIGVLLTISIRNGDINLLNLMLNSGAIYLMFFGVQLLNLFIARAATQCAKNARIEKLPQKLLKEFQSHVYANAAVIIFGFYTLSFAFLVNMFALTFTSAERLIHVLLPNVRLFVQIYAIIFLYKSLHLYLSYKTELLTIEKNENSGRLRTVLQLFAKCAEVATLIICALMLLVNYGFSISAILGALASVGLAFGLACQDALKSLIHGVIMLIEKDIAVGDEVTVCGFQGVIEEIGIRTMKVREVNGVLHSIPYSNIQIVSNRSRNYFLHWMEMYFPASENIDRINEILNESMKEAAATDYIKARIVDPGLLNYGLCGFDDLGSRFIVVGYAKPEVNSGFASTFYRILRAKLRENNMPLPICTGPRPIIENKRVFNMVV